MSTRFLEPTVPEHPVARIDGRRLRSERTKQLIIEAYMALVRENAQVPTAQQIAERAGYSVRSIFERFPDLEALRIAVNHELEHLQHALDHGLYESLRPGGRLVVITFHSLEDRLVKNAFRDETRWQCLHKKPVAPSPQEIRINPRSRSAKLRVALKVPRIAVSASPK